MPIAGKVMPRPMGDYNPATIYGVLDIVNHDERPWMCRKDNTQNVEPTVLNTDNWQMLFDVDVTNADTLDGFDSSYFGTKEVQDSLVSECDDLTAKCESIKTGINTITMVTFAAASWEGETAPFTQTVTVSNITSADSPIPLFIDDGTTESESKDKKKAYGCISYFESGEGEVTAVCKYTKPVSDFSVGLQGVITYG